MEPYSYISQNLISNGLNLFNLSPQEQDSEETVWVAIGKRPEAIKFANLRFREEFDLAVKGMFLTQGKTYEYLSPSLKENLEIALLAFKLDNAHIHNIPPELFTLEFSKKIIQAFLFNAESQNAITEPIKIPVTLREHLDFALNESTSLSIEKKEPNEIVKKLAELCPSLMQDAKLAKEIIERFNYCAEFVSKDLTDDFQFMEPLILKQPLLVRYASLETKENKEFLLKLLEGFNSQGKGIIMLGFWSPKFFEDKEVILKALEKDKSVIYSYKKLSDNLKNDFDVLYAFLANVDLQDEENIYMREIQDNLPLEIKRKICNHSEELSSYAQQYYLGDIDKMIGKGIGYKTFAKAMNDFFQDYLKVVREKELLLSAITKIDLPNEAPGLVNKI